MNRVEKIAAFLKERDAALNTIGADDEERTESAYLIIKEMSTPVTKKETRLRAI